MKISLLKNHPVFTLKNISIDSFQSVSIDSRYSNSKTLFCPLLGDNTDGHLYINQAIKQGAPASLVNQLYFDNHPEIHHHPLIIVKDTLEALQILAKLYAASLSTKILGITGSSGKTSTRDLIHFVLEGFIKTSVTRKNYNNHIGYPLSILNISPDSDLAILELGANHPKEIENLCNIAKPDFGLITTISNAHIGGFGSIENIIRTKFELFDSVLESGVLFINNDDNYIKSYNDTSKKRITYGINNSADHTFAIDSIDHFGHCTLSVDGHKIHLNNPGYGAAINAAAAYTVARYFEMDIELIIEKIEDYLAPSGRGNKISYKDITLYDDTYNANPQSVLLGIKNLSTIKTDGNKYFILGDMLELGESSSTEHRKIGAQIASSDIDYLFCYGDESKETITQARKNGLANAIHFSSKKLLSATLRVAVKPGDTIYLKGSRGMQMETIIRDIKGEA